MTNPAHIHERLLNLFARLEGLGLRHAPLKDAELSLPQFGLLFHIGRAPGIHVAELAENLGVTTPTVSVMLRKLEKSRWLRRKSDPKDKRAARLYLTAKSLALAQRVRSFRKKRVNEFMHALTAVEQDQLLSLLEKAIGNLEEKHSYKDKVRPNAAEGV